MGVRLTQRLIVEKIRPFAARRLLDSDDPTTAQSQDEAEHSLATLCRFLQSFFGLAFPIASAPHSRLTRRLTRLSPVQNQAAMLLTEALRILDVLHVGRFVTPPSPPHP